MIAVVHVMRGTSDLSESGELFVDLCGCNVKAAGLCIFNDGPVTIIIDSRIKE